jgi:GT2 family glycosyltransferase
VLIIVLCWNGVELTLSCLESLRRLTYRHADVLVVDNASTDGTPAAVRARFQEAIVIENSANLNFTGGNNVGLRYALDHDYEYVLLLNNDTEVAPDLLDAMLAACAEDPTIGVAGPKIYYYNRPEVIWSAGGLIDWARGRTSMRGLGTVDHGQFDTQVDVDFIPGCALLVRRSALRQAGLLDERFGFYYDEVEWCVRVARARWRIVYVPTGRLWHKIQSEPDSPRVTYYMTRNRLLFLRLTGAPIRAWLRALLLQDLRTCLSWSLRPKWGGKRGQRDALLRGWWDFVGQRFERPLLG